MRCQGFGGVISRCRRRNRPRSGLGVIRLCLTHKNAAQTLWPKPDASGRTLLAPCTTPMPAVAPTTDLPRPFKPRVEASAMNALHRVLDRNPIWYALALFLLKTPPLYRAFTFVERSVKQSLFACRMCGQCALPVTAYACPMTCPKQLRNGPCGGGSPDGSCEVCPGMRGGGLIADRR